MLILLLRFQVDGHIKFNQKRSTGVPWRETFVTDATFDPFKSCWDSHFRGTVALVWVLVWYEKQHSKEMTSGGLRENWQKTFDKDMSVNRPCGPPCSYWLPTFSPDFSSSYLANENIWHHSGQYAQQVSTFLRAFSLSVSTMHEALLKIP
jgi:hypothetical protein